MPHILSRLSDAKLELVKQMLEQHAPDHNAQGMYLQHLWQNADNPSEVLFLFRVDDLEKSMERMKRIHAETRRDHPDMKIPETTYLADA